METTKYQEYRPVRLSSSFIPPGCNAKDFLSIIYHAFNPLSAVGYSDDLNILDSAAVQIGLAVGMDTERFCL